MSLFAVRDAIQARLAAIPNIGVVHHYERYVEDLDKFREAFMVGKRVRGGYLTRTRTREQFQSTSHNDETHVWRFNYYVGWLEAENSARGFEILVEAIRDAFRDDETLGGVVDTTNIDGLAGIQLDDAGPVMFAGLLCHGARFSMQSRNTVEPGNSAIDDFATGSIHTDATAPESAPTSDDVFQLETQA